MKKITVNALQEKIRETIPGLSAKVPYFGLTTDGYSVTFDIDLDCTSITYEEFEALSILFNTKKISTSDFTHTRGCETCDWGGTKTATVYLTAIPKESFETLLKSLNITF